MRSPAVFLLGASLLIGCPGGADGRDAGADTGTLGDVGGSVDGGPVDAPPPDAGEHDAGEPDAPPTSCPPPPSCDAPLPDLGATDDWRHSIATPITTAMGAPRHRGRDLILREEEPQWALAKFAYGLADDDLKDEDVDVWLDRGCTGTWERLATVATTNDGDHSTVEEVEDTGGRVFFEIPAPSRLALGRHRVVFVVRGDHSTATQYIDVLPASTRVIVTDMDGTQTSSETADWVGILTGTSPTARPYGAEALRAFQERGYHVFYLTARPEWLVPRTRDWLVERGYPAGTLHTTLGGTGALGSAAIGFKTGELAWLDRHLPGSLEWAIGNTDTDVAAYAMSGVPPERLVAYEYDPGTDGTRVDDYATLLDDAAAEPIDCH